MVKGHNVRFVINLKLLTIHHELITFHIHDGHAPLESTEWTM
jgi:hypothetical protein